MSCAAPWFTGYTWVVVGLSNNTDRDAWGVAGVLRRFGKRVVPVHPRAETVQGERGYATLLEIPFPVGVVDHAARERVSSAGLSMVMDRCPAIENPKLA